MSKPMCSSSNSASDNQQRDPDNSVDQLAATISFKFNQSLQLDQNDPDDEDEEEFVDCEDDEQDNHEGNADFTFMHLGENNSPVPADKSSEKCQIQPVYPLFDQNLLSGDDGNQLPIQIPVEKVFIESPQRAPSSSTSEYDDTAGIGTGPYRTLSKQPATENPELSKKSNSTGFSRLWRFRGKVGRSNSDGRDAFVFLKKSDKKTPSSKPVAKRTTVGGSLAKGNAAGGGKTKVVNKGTKVQNENIAAHEVYLRKREQTEERRRCYLPYRPEIMGFFTNVNGGLSRNVHPY